MNKIAIGFLSTFLISTSSVAQIYPFTERPDGSRFLVEFHNKTPHELEVQKVWQQCVVTHETDRSCGPVKPGESCELVVVNDCHGNRRTEIRYRAFINNKNMAKYREHCSNTHETSDCYAVTVKARNPTGGDGKATTTVTRKSKHYSTSLNYDTRKHRVNVVVGG